MIEAVRDFLLDTVPEGFLAHLSTLAGFLLAFFFVARLMGEKRAPSNTFAWLLVIILIPWLGVPLYLLFGGRKLRRILQNKNVLCPVLPGIHPGEATGIGCPSVATTVTAAGGSLPVGGNRVRFLRTGEEDFDELERQIRAARSTIHVTTFILGRDATGRRIMALLAERAREGVKVRLLLDALGSFRSSRGFTAPLRRAGGEVGRFMPVLPFSSRGSANLRNHRKMAIFDHRIAMIGGRNLAREYMGPTPHPKRWRDFGAVLEGPAALLLNEVFIADWCFATRQPIDRLNAEVPREPVPTPGSCELQVVASGPDVPGDPLYEGIVSMIQEAEHSIWIVTPYFIPDDVLLRSLIVKARAGREVTLIVPAHSNHPVTDFARRYYTRELRRAGGRLLLYGGGMLHAKAVLVDNRVALVGSPNFDLRSLFVNFEIGVLVYSRPELIELRAWIDDLVLSCHAPLPEQRHRLARSVAEDLSRLLAPLL
jgi:cardiolipin synthase